MQNESELENMKYKAYSMSSAQERANIIKDFKIMSRKKREEREFQWAKYHDNIVISMIVNGIVPQTNSIMSREEARKLLPKELIIKANYKEWNL